MKKNYIAFLVILTCTFTTIHALASVMTSKASGNWGNAGSWNSVTLAETTYTRPNSAIDTIIIEAGHRIVISSSWTFNGILIVKGTLYFQQNTSSEGRLTMDGDSKIFIRDGGLITSDGNGGGNNAGTNNWISIGGTSINGWQIRDNLGSPDYIDASTIRYGGGCQYSPLGCSPTMLPIELLYFRSTATNQGIQLEWASAKEWNFSHYTVERSSDGKEFTPIHTEYVNGDSHSSKTYSFLDMQPSFGANYYRLKATDIDDSFEYKGMALAYSGMKGDLQVYPNPAKGGLVTINNPGAIEGTWLSIIATTGNELMRIQMSEQELRLPTSALPAGVYVVRVWNHLEVKQARLVIQ
ncbi:T9SS type A sorting domain-containing protein [Cesiribacter sp. SM1]|uniref:T9SS type A sorting domain-containing protein n=1 Tax=Cesiribacter sp. SM1 TaxID=2861196 RepID=UPI001CD3B1BD|nr:T9SS type A sorting domain-containing protein [Cesiribacter sp. SM1]